MQVWTVTGQTDAGMYSYWIDRCWYGELLDRMMQVWTVTGQNDAGIDSYWIDCYRYGQLLNRLMKVDARKD